jgi:hypothetical protein
MIGMRMSNDRARHAAPCVNVKIARRTVQTAIGIDDDWRTRHQRKIRIAGTAVREEIKWLIIGRAGPFQLAKSMKIS